MGLIFQGLMGSGPSDKTWQPAVVEGNVLYNREGRQQGTGAEKVHALVLNVEWVI